MFEQAKHSLEDAKQFGLRPNSNSPEDRHEYVERAFATSDGLMAALQSPLGSNPWIYDLSIVDHEGLVLVSSDKKIMGPPPPLPPPSPHLHRHTFLHQFQ